MGMATGPVVAGVVGSHRFFYDVWGDAVNVAVPDGIHRLGGTDSGARGDYERLKDDFVLRERG